MDALIEVRIEEICLRDAGILQSATVLVACSSVGHSSSSRLAVPVPLVSPPVVPPAARGERWSSL
jgi:predicted phosphoribosyltransferase